MNGDVQRCLVAQWPYVGGGSGHRIIKREEVKSGKPSMWVKQ